MRLVRHRLDDLEKDLRSWSGSIHVRHRLDDLETCLFQLVDHQDVRHRLDDLETYESIPSSYTDSSSSPR